MVPTHFVLQLVPGQSVHAAGLPPHSQSQLGDTSLIVERKLRFTSFRDALISSYTRNSSLCMCAHTYTSFSLSSRCLCLLFALFQLKLIAKLIATAQEVTRSIGAILNTEHATHINTQ